MHLSVYEKEHPHIKSWAVVFLEVMDLFFCQGSLPLYGWALQRQGYTVSEHPAQLGVESLYLVGIL